jgi:DNA end-binding protein Ku
MVEPWKPEKYEDTYRKELLAFVRRKAQRGDTEQVDETPPPRRAQAEIGDVMSLLKQSLEKAGAGGRRPSGRRHGRRPGKSRAR